MDKQVAAIEPEILDNIIPFSGTQEVVKAESMTPMQQVKSSYTTAVAVQKPRSLAVVMKNILTEAQMGGDSFYYGWTVKGKNGSKRVEGATVGLAYALARNYGNCAIETNVIESASHYMVTAVFVDLETGFSCPRTFRQRKGIDMGERMDKDRVEDIALQIAESKAIRNAVLKAMPSWLVEKAIETAKLAVQKGVGSNIIEARAQALKVWETVGVSKERIEAAINRPVEEWTPETIAELRGSWNAYKEGRISLDELFPRETDIKTESKEDEKENKTKSVSGKDDKALKSELYKALIKEKFTPKDIELAALPKALADLTYAEFKEAADRLRKKDVVE